MKSGPILSIVIALPGEVSLSPEYQDFIDETLATSETEVVLAFSSAWEFDKFRSDSPILRVYSPDNRSLLKLWGMGLSAASGKYLATLDARCPPAPNWIHTARKNIISEPSCFYGSVETKWAMGNINLLGYLIEYAQFKAPVSCISEYPGNNIVFKAELLDDQPTLSRLGFQKTFMLWRLEKSTGVKPHYSTDMPVFYGKEYSIPEYFFHLFRHGRCFASNRLSQVNQPSRIVCILFSPFVGILRIFRLFRNVFRKPSLLLSTILYFPLIFLAEHSWALGEFLGYGFGDGGACDRLE